MPVIATTLTSAIQPFIHEAAAPMLVFTQTRGVADHPIVVVVPLQLAAKRLP
jgi:hypothetical protein